MTNWLRASVAAASPMPGCDVLEEIGDSIGDISDALRSTDNLDKTQIIQVTCETRIYV